LIEPKFVLPYEPGFRPAALVNRAFRQEAAVAGALAALVIGLQCSDGEFSRFETQVFPAGHPCFAANLFYVEWLVKIFPNRTNLSEYARMHRLWYG
jgi:hypothetical protein